MRGENTGKLEALEKRLAQAGVVTYRCPSCKTIMEPPFDYQVWKGQDGQPLQVPILICHHCKAEVTNEEDFAEQTKTSMVIIEAWKPSWERREERRKSKG